MTKDKQARTMLEDLQALMAPEGFEQVTDVNEKVQAGDSIYDADDLEWYPASRAEVGKYVAAFTCVYRLPAVAPTAPTVKRLKRSRRP